MKQHAWRWLRRGVQLAVLGLFVVLFRRAEYNPHAPLAPSTNIFFRFDPLVALGASLATRRLIPAFLGALLILLLTLVFGRFVCGWLCPLGTLLDIWQKLIGAVRQRVETRFGAVMARLRPLRFGLLAVCLAAALVGAPLIGLLDPIAILTRGLAIGVDPLSLRGTTALARRLYDSPRVSPWSEPVYSFLKAHVLPGQANHFSLVTLSLALLALPFLLELVRRRFWCRYLCPLGALLSTVARFAFLRRRPQRICPTCQSCAATCRMDAFRESRVQSESCTLCLDCQTRCPQDLVQFRFPQFHFPKRSRQAAPADARRRLLLGSAAAGLALSLGLRRSHVARPQVPSTVLRPPGAQDEDAFLDRCSRCGECLKVCLTNGLQPGGLEAGLDGLYAPRLVPRIGACELNCTLCGEACPSGAIPRLSLAEKIKTPIGRARIDKEQCLPWAAAEPCIVCEEHCPLDDKAIRTETVTVRAPGPEKDGREVVLSRPFVDEERCIGCGLCEHVCPLQEEGRTGIRVRRV